MDKRLFETGVKGLDRMMGGGIRWGCSVSVASDLIDGVTLCHQIVANALSRGFIVNYMCFKEAPERIRLQMEDLDINAEEYEKKRLLRFYTPLETELTRDLKESSELLNTFDKFIMKLMKDVTLQVMRGKKVLFILNNVSSLADMFTDEPKWKGFTVKGSTWLRKLVKVISLQICDQKDLEVAESLADFCIVMENIDGIPYLKVTKFSTQGWVPYRLASDGVEVAEEFIF
jgi:KaiC/GvpD/RAD55 family RecA-like ATPase